MSKATKALSLCLTSAFLLSGCQATGSGMAPVSKLHTELSPELGVRASAELGETILERTRGMGTPGFRVGDVAIEHNGYRFMLPSNRYEARRRTQSGQLVAYGYNQVRAVSEGIMVIGSGYSFLSSPDGSGCVLHMQALNLNDQNGNYLPNWAKSVDESADEGEKDVDISLGNRTILGGNLPENSSSLFTVEIPERQCSERYTFSSYSDTFRQELIYLGRSGNELSFTYREFSGNLARPAFSADLKYDLSESKTIGYRGARVEVLEAGNQTIQYRVTKHMSGM